MSTALVQHDNGGPSISAFASDASFETAQRIAKALASSSIVPKDYQNNIPNVLVAMELANRTGSSVLQVMQSLHVIQGRPSWSAAFLIATVNASGRFSPLRYEWRGEQGSDDWACRAVAKDKSDGEVLEGSWISWAMAEAEGWTKKAGSKYKTMPEQMLRYRAAAFWTRAYAPEIALGMLTSGEVESLPVLASVEVDDLNAVLEEVEAVDVPTDVEVAQLRELMDTAGLDYEAAADCELMIQEDEGARVRAKILELQRAVIAAAPEQLPLEGEAP